MSFRAMYLSERAAGRDGAEYRESTPHPPRPPSAGFTAQALEQMAAWHEAHGDSRTAAMLRWAVSFTASLPVSRPPDECPAPERTPTDGSPHPRP